MDIIFEKIIEKTLFINQVFAQEGRNIGAGTEGRTIGTKSLDKILTDLTGFLVGLGLAIAALMIIYAAYLMLTAGGNSDNFEKGKKTIIYVIVGVAVLLLSRAIITIIKQLIGV